MQKGVGDITRKGVRVQELLLERIKKEDHLISTRQLALILNLSWHTVQQHCLSLQVKKKIDGFQIAGSYLWIRKGSFIVKKQEDETLLQTFLDTEIKKLKDEINILKQKKIESKTSQKIRERETTAQNSAGGEKNVE
ncbi:hypothetical protein HZC31_01280 [Candidatus Woesearchaeota archaeon]|nr:hypothetical protein [Candidatus Woesearchaeota archaeon]